MDPRTGTVLASMILEEAHSVQPLQAPIYIPPWDAEDQLRRGKSFLPMTWNSRTIPAEGTLAAHTNAERNFAVIDCFNNATILTPQIPYNTRNDAGYYSPTLVAVDNANNLYFISTKMEWRTSYWSPYEVFCKYNSLGVLLWEVTTSGLGVSSTKAQPVFYDNQNKISIGKEYIMMFDTNTGEVLFDVGDMTMALDTPRWTGSDNRVVFMDVYNTTTSLWEPRLLVEKSGLNQVTAMEWAKLWLVDAIGKLSFNKIDSLGAPSSVTILTYINGVATFINTNTPYTFVESFTLGVKTGSIGYDVANEVYPITTVEDQTVTIVIDKLSFEDRNSYDLYTPQDIVDMQTRYDNTGIYNLMNDIDMSGVYFMAAFANEYKPFMGDFYGNGFEISNLVITKDMEFAWVNTGFLANCRNAIIENLKFRSCSVDNSGSNGAVGILAGRLENAKLTNDTSARPVRLHDIVLEDCTVTSATTSGTGVAVGKFTADTAYSPEPLRNVVVKSSVINPQSGRNIGGAIGYINNFGPQNTSMLFENIYAETVINLKTGVAFRTIGGAVGVLYFNTNAIVNAMLAKTIISEGNYYNVGLVGEFYGYDGSTTLSNLGADMKLLGAPTSNAAGLIGYASIDYDNAPASLIIDKVYSAINTPTVATKTDTLIAELYKGSGAEQVIVTNSYHDMELNTFANTYGTSARSTAEMKSKANYQNWDFVNIWNIKEGSEYPTFLIANDPPISIEFDFFEDAGLGLTDLEIRLGTFKRMRAIATFEDQSTADVSASVSIVADPANLTSITGNKIKALGVGFAQLSVSYNGYTEIGFVDLYGPDTVEVTSPNGLSLTAGKKLRLKSKAIFKDGYVQDVSLISDWESDAPDIISVTDDGVVQAVGGGFAGITSTYYEVTGYLDLTVSSMEPPIISKIDINSATAYVYFTLLDPISDITYFRASAYLEENKTTLLDYADVLTKPENFRVSRNKGASWSQIPADGTIPSKSGEDIYCVKLFVGPRTKVWIDVGAALIEGAGGPIDPGESTDDVDAPVVTVLPATGLYNSDQSVVITTDEPADVYYTLDETTPTINSSKYSGPITITDNATLMYFAVDALDNPTHVLTETYSFNRILPVISSKLASGNYTGTQLAQLVTSKGDIYYTLDGTEPSTSSTLYTSSIIIPEDATTVLKFFAIDDYGNVSETITLTYTVISAPAGTSFGKPILLTAPGSSAAVLSNASMRDVYFLVSGLTIGNSYTIETVNPNEAGTYIDCQLYIYNTSQVQIGYDDDSAATQGLSKIIFTAAETSIYAKVNDYGSNNDITFQLKII
jgi:hypothetical protein